ncbi:Helicase domain protein [Carbonactinospora thermoautotrophica]|uniref:Helicase domain protein n=1 Tax=Carbonactinospora thermoautotrophica TaxID=1469144 RepID=A0A132MVD6_9ACTN|nr:helicase-related protein [Carbonactinospora thermoautotrophica]KWX01821.1 Helicase domain protein [Carbonactinospora thermoautotrophica]
MSRYAPGSLVAARGREWVVLPGSTEEFVVARPLGGDADFVAGLFPEEVSPASLSRPSADPAEIGDHRGASLLRTALRIGFRSSAGPFRSLAGIAVEPRQYQLVPLLLALRMETVRLLIADDVGIGKTIEAALVAKELLEQGDAAGLTVLCSPALAEQWAAELREKFAIDATLVLPSTAARLERDLPPGQSLFDHHRYTVVSTDFIKSDLRRAAFLRTCPDLVIVDEAHTCVPAGAGSGRRQRQLRYELLRGLADKPDRHLILVTATPHSGKEGSFRDLLGLLDPALAQLDLEQVKNRERLARHFVQRRRRDIRHFLDEETPFPLDRQLREVTYELGAEYKALHEAVLDYARASVTGPEGLAQRVRWWSALALLRSVASSPRAAAATLRTRAAAAGAATVAEADELGRAAVLDATDEDTLEGVDAPPGADDETLPAADRRRLLEFAKKAEQLEGPQCDRKLAKLIDEVKALLADGYDPIVFCRFIPTAEYVAEHLAKALGRKAHVEAVTGTLPPEERATRVADLAGRDGRHVLVATDCLSEGINLQEHFQAVVHYDLAWNPTRHEQREGRVDRFGQRRPYVRAVTLYGVDNAIDGVVLDVLIRKGRKIRHDTGVAVPVPDRGETLLNALVEGLLLRRQDGTQIPLDFEVTKHRDELHREWESAAERESKAITKYAHSAIKLDEVRAEVDAIRAALGAKADIAGFVRDTLAELKVPVRDTGDGFAAPTHLLPAGTRHMLTAALGTTPEELVFHRDLPVPPGEHALVRTDPAVAALARYVFDTALDPAEAERPARRCGVIRTAAVPARTTLLLVRYRFHLTLPGRQEKRTVVAEDARMLAYRGRADEPEWLTDEEVTELLAAQPDANLLPELVRRQAERAIDDLDALQDALDARGGELAEELHAAHQRVRGVVGATRRGLSVTFQPRADVIGVYVYLPGGAR